MCQQLLYVEDILISANLTDIHFKTLSITTTTKNNSFNCYPRRHPNHPLKDL